MGRLLEEAGLRVVFKRFTDFEEQQDCIRRAAVSDCHVCSGYWSQDDDQLRWNFVSMWVRD